MYETQGEVGMLCPHASLVHVLGIFFFKVVMDFRLKSKIEIAMKSRQLSQGNNNKWTNNDVQRMGWA